MISHLEVLDGRSRIYQPLHLLQQHVGGAACLLRPVCYHVQVVVSFKAGCYEVQWLLLWCLQK